MNGNVAAYGISRVGNTKNMSKRKARKNAKKRRVYFASTVLVAVIVLMITMSNLMQTKADEKLKSSDRIYSSILIEEGDTLWDIAKEYKPDEVSVTNYIKSIKKINGLNSDNIHSGNYLIIYYYED